MKIRLEIDGATDPSELRRIVEELTGQTVHVRIINPTTGS